MEKIFFKKFDDHNLKNAHVGIKKDTTTQMPRLILELIGMITFSTLVIYLLNSGKNINEIFVIVGVFFLRCYKIVTSRFKNCSINTID